MTRNRCFFSLVRSARYHTSAFTMCVRGCRVVCIFKAGGETRKSAGPRTEGQTYWEIADHHSWFGHPNVREHAYAEIQARDSYENLLFSLCRFRQLSGACQMALLVFSYWLSKKFTVVQVCLNFVFFTLRPLSAFYHRSRLPIQGIPLHRTPPWCSTVPS